MKGVCQLPSCQGKVVKKKYAIFIMFGFITIALAACQTAQTPDEVKAPSETDNAYPALESELDDQAYPVEQFIPLLGAAYPVSEEDVQMLIQSWTLSDYSENNVIQDIPAKTIRFYADGSYELAIDSNTIMGSWTTRLTSFESVLILDPGSDQPLTFDILDLNASQLHLRSLQEGIQIDEEYQPAN